MRLHKREAKVYHVDIYFFGAKAAETFNPLEVRGVLSSEVISSTQLRILTMAPKLIEEAAEIHEKLILEELRAARLAHLAELGSKDALSVTSPGGDVAEIKAMNTAKTTSKTTKKRGCRGCGK